MIHAFASVRIHGEFYIYYPDWCPNHHLYAIIMKINEKFIRCLGEKLKEIQTKRLLVFMFLIYLVLTSKQQEGGSFIYR